MSWICQLLCLDQHVLDSVLEITGVRLITGSPLLEGESSAWRTRADDGSVFTLKLHWSAEHLGRFRNAEEVTSHLRSSGYPAPRHVGSDRCRSGSWQLIEWVAAEPLQHPTHTILVQLLELINRQRCAGRCSLKWTNELIDSVLDGKDGHCETASLLHYSVRSRELLDGIQQWALAARNSTSRSEDVVHFDFHPGNILVEHGDVRAVIDWDGTCSGDATFDLVTLLYYCYDNPSLRTRILTEIQEQVPVELLRLYMAHMILRQVDWSIRHHDAGTIDHYLTRSEHLVSDRRAR